VLEAWRDSRGRLLSIGAAYYDALDLNNGSLAPFADDCVRFENGGQSARKPVPTGASEDSFAPFGALGCARQLDTQVMAYITRIDNRRVWIADEENGLVFGLSHFRHAMEKTEWPTYGVQGVPFRKIDYKPFDLPAAKHSAKCTPLPTSWMQFHPFSFEISTTSRSRAALTRVPACSRRPAATSATTPIAARRARAR